VCAARDTAIHWGLYCGQLRLRRLQKGRRACYVMLMARTKATMTKRPRARVGTQHAERTGGGDLDSLRKAFADFDDIVIAEPAVKPSPEVARAIRKAVRDYFASLHARRSG